MTKRGQTPFVFAAGIAPRLIATRVVALYEPDSGRIVHLHTSHVYGGANEPAESTLIARAKQHAQRLGHNPDLLASKVSDDPLHGRIPHRIDTDSGTFVALTA